MWVTPCGFESRPEHHFSEGRRKAVFLFCDFPFPETLRPSARAFCYNIQSMKIALLSNVTIEVFAGMLREEHAVWTPPGFGAWMETALNPPEDLISFSPDLVCVLLDARFGDFDARVQSRDAARRALASAFPRATVLIPDLSAHFADLGEQAYDARMWTLARMPWSMSALLELKKLFSPPKKVLALDLDNTLWSGVVGEDGPSGVVPDLALQRAALDLKARGILLVALSKNDLEDVAPVWRDTRMLLHEEDFVAMRINWNDKSANLADVARELNLAPDSFVFVDDNPGNRAEMRASLPAVAVAPFPPVLDEYFPPREATDEDRVRTELYQAESRRRNLAASLSYDDYLAALDIRTEIRPLEEGDVARVAQLAQKSNQFNVCTNRWTEGDVRAFARDPSRLVLVLRASDRFGDLGLVAFVHAALADGEAEVVDWVMSCRAMNRRIEFALEREFERRLAERGVRTLRASWRRTARNAPVASLFDKFDFDLVDSSDDVRHYVRRLPQR